MKPFAAPVDDILFSLEHVAGAGRLPGYDPELAREIVGHFASFAEREIAPLDEPGDRAGCRLENGRVRMPDGFAKAYRAYAEQGWPGLALPESAGGQGVGAAVAGAVTEIFAGACHSMQMVCGLVPGAARTILAFGSDHQAERLLPPLASGEWLSTMCLTEPEAGSDLSGIRVRGIESDGTWRLHGDKIFISGGDQDLSGGILHLVLARTGDADTGTRGLGLFACRSADDAARRNRISVSRIEEKMGLHASPTCQLAFDGAEAELIGRPGDGLKAMFTMMNHARLDVALQGVAHAARAADIAKAFASERRQGRDGAGRPVTIDRHPDVARMLETQEALAIGGRALCHVALVALEAGEDAGLVDFLTPVCKVFCTEAGMRAADLGIQVLGGYGYLREYRVEQTLRDARITAIYEGTNGIHALALATRMLRADDGRAADAFEGFLRASPVLEADRSELEEAIELWAAARRRVLAAADPADHAHAFMALTGAVAYRAAWARIAVAAAASSDPDRLARLAARVRRGALAEARSWASQV